MNENTTSAVLIGTSADRQVEFFRVGDQIYRVWRGWIPCALSGMPMGMRWECSVSHFERFRHNAFDWIVPIQ